MSADGPVSDLPLHTRVRQSSAQVHVSIQESTVILSLDQNTYFSLNEVGSVLWGLMREPVTLEACCQHIIDCYEIDAPRCQADVLALARELISAGLVEIA